MTEDLTNDQVDELLMGWRDAAARIPKLSYRSDMWRRGWELWHFHNPAGQPRRVCDDACTCRAASSAIH